MEISEYVKELNEIWHELEISSAARGPEISFVDLALGILRERAKDRRMAEINAKRNGNGQPAGAPKVQAPNNVDAVRQRLGDDSRLVDISTDQGRIYIKLHAKLAHADFQRAVEAVKNLGAIYDSMTREWVI